MEKRVSFEEWIRAYGIENLAKKLNVHPKTVWYWQTSATDPRVDQMRRIKFLTKGVISYEQMIDRKVRSSKVIRVL